MPHTSQKTAIVLVNLGSPKSAATKDVRLFLKEFLQDKRVIELPRIIWLPILYALVLPFRPRKSARNYRKIWLENQMSPLIYYSKELGAQLQSAVSANFSSGCSVHTAMRYGEPNLQSVLDQLSAQQVDNILLLPLYPQYSSTTVATIVDVAYQHLSKQRNIAQIRYLKDYHDHPLYIEAMAEDIKRHWQRQRRGNMLLFSFHGLPERNIELGDPYYEQSKTSAQLLAKNLGLGADEWQFSFQSRFGAQEWIKPYTTTTLAELAAEKKYHVDVYCPGFAVDCLETLEEIAIGERQLFLEQGGLSFNYIPALNDSPQHVKLMLQLIKEHGAGWL